MKRLIAFVLILSLLIPAAAFADLPDISSLSKDELIQLDRMIQSALFDQALPSGVLVPAGDYIVGVDLPAGDYRADVVSDVGGVVTVYRSKEEAEKRALSYLTEINLGNMWGTLVFRLTLEEGNYLRLKYNSIKLSPYAGLVDLSVPRE